MLFTDHLREHQGLSALAQADFSRFKTMLMTDELLLYYKRCRRRAFLDIHGDLSLRDPEQDFLLKLRQDSVTHRRAVLADMPHQSPYYPRGNWDAGAKATLELMQQGVECISQGVLLMQTADGVTMLSRPDLLIKQDGQSDFGDWMYASSLIKLGRRPKQEYQIVAAFSTQLLAQVQGAWPSAAWLILRRQDLYTVQLERVVPLMQEILSDCIETLRQPQEPEVFISRQKCGLCQWYGSCYAIAQSQQHMSLLPGVTPSRYRDLQSLEITTLDSLAKTTISTLEPTLGHEIASALVQQAQSTVQNQPLIREQYLAEAETPQSFTPTPALPTAPIELYFDIEAEPELQLDYLLGVLVVDNRTQTSTFHAFLAEQPQDEAAIWQQFLDCVELYPDSPIFHFSDYEVETVKRLARLYKTPRRQVNLLLSRFVDMHQQVMSTVTLPVESYSLKHLARWLGFEWRDPDVTGSQCVCLYDQWLKTGDRTLLDVILRYNEDDCRATHRLKNWLGEFLQDTIESCP